MASGGDGTGRTRRVGPGVTALYGALYVSALFLLVTGFLMEPAGCGSRANPSCSAETNWRLGVGFGLIFVGGPVLHKLLPGTPLGRGTSRKAAVAALLLGSAIGVALAEAGVRAVS
ncbi:hypothetical protein ACIRQY_31185 [Streptomyces sp. NPDC101490]|uniref:hypothetical protein n=1 Tax=Streptomyces sp. NPDC101490 TaxID=3366143 RepID=UPI00380E3604